MRVKFFSVRTEGDGLDVLVHLEAEDLGERFGRQQVNVAESAMKCDLRMTQKWFQNSCFQI
jgi:hypothetical protein